MKKVSKDFIEVYVGDIDNFDPKNCKILSNKKRSVRKLDITFDKTTFMNKVKELLNLHKKYSKVPLIVAANTEAGGNGACVGGTEIGQEVKVAATNEKKYAYELGRVSALEAKAVGCNTVFAPIVDIHHNWHNLQLMLVLYQHLMVI